VQREVAAEEHRAHGAAAERAHDLVLGAELAREQLALADRFDYVIVNDDLDRAVAELEEIVNRETGRLPAT
jgi:guanylate kinase